MKVCPSDKGDVMIKVGLAKNATRKMPQTREKTGNFPPQAVFLPVFPDCGPDLAVEPRFLGPKTLACETTMKTGQLPQTVWIWTPINYRHDPLLSIRRKPCRVARTFDRGSRGPTFAKPAGRRFAAAAGRPAGMPGGCT
jgi:hypothetical protein